MLCLIESSLLDENGRKLAKMLLQCFLDEFVFGAILLRHVRITTQRQRDIRPGYHQAASDQSVILRDNFLHREFSPPDE